MKLKGEESDAQVENINEGTEKHKMGSCNLDNKLQDIL